MSETPPSNPTALLYAALAKAQGAYLNPAKNRTATDYNEQGELVTWQYADLDEILWAVRGAFAANGLAIVQRITTVYGSNGLHLISEIVHEGGGIISSVVPLISPGDFNDVKQYGAQLTYLRRYSIEPLLGITSYYDEPGATTITGDNKPPRIRIIKNDQKPVDSLEEYDQFQTNPNTHYDQAEFESSLEAWERGIQDKQTTPERLIQILEAKAPLTAEQREKILGLGA